MDADFFRIAWITWATSGLVLEFVALLSRTEGSTLSETVWSLRGSGFYSLIVFFLLWLTYHFLFEGRAG
jgi:hypothetical protein